MVRSAIAIAIVSVLASHGVAFSQSGAAPAVPPIVQVKDRAELQQKFCAANPSVETVVVLPAVLFVDSELLICGNGPYKMYRIVDNNDTDDFEYFLDPPIYARESRLACDGKAGRNMIFVAINCRPVK